MSVRWLAFCLLLLTGAPLTAQVEVVEFESTDQAQLYQELIKELRCLVCQNQNLADSNADLAIDLRRKVVEMVTAGKDRTAITDYMVERYGEFVLYRPRLNRATYLLWLSPFVILIGVIITTVYLVRRSRNTLSTHHTPEEIARARALMKGEKS